ncbi:MAG: FAD-dependent oxidoreductase [Proteobacteria bacterium]|nr:FAD-dependent oxidoreductase [Pseudomonadota bacterium]
MATVFVEQLALPASIGVWPEERQRQQLISLDIEVTVGDAELAAAAASQRLRDALDYRTIAELAERVVALRHYPLVESLAHELAHAMLGLPGVQRARIRLRKLHCVAHAHAAGVEVSCTADTDDAACEAIGPDAVATTLAPIVIAGGGVAGLSAALWCWRLGQPALLVDPAEQLGGQLLLATEPLPDLPAHAPLAGPVLARQLRRQFVAHGGRWLRARVQRIDRALAGSGGLRLALRLAPDGGALTLDCRALILATGLRRRPLSAPGAVELLDRGVLTRLPPDPATLREQAIVIVGGGDTACDAALALLPVAASVTLVHRGGQLSARHPLRQAVLERPAIAVLTRAEVARLHGAAHLQAVELRDGRMLPAPWLLVAIGWQPNNEGLPNAWLDAHGFVRSDHELRVVGESSAFVAGDLRHPAAASFAAAAGDGACAAKSAVRRLEADDPAAAEH